VRITFNGHYREAQAGLERASERLVELQRQVASGRRLNTPSDAPADAATAISERAALSAVEHYERSADGVAARLTVADAALSSIVDRISAASTAAASVRGSGRTTAQREAAAQQLTAIRDTIIADLNTSFRGTYVFAAADGAERPFVTDGAGVATYQGGADEVELDIGDGRAVTVAFDGRAVTQGDDSTDLLAALAGIIDAAHDDDQDALADGMQALSRALERTTTMQARIGSVLHAVDSEKSRLLQLRLAAANRVAAVENADMAEVITGMAQADAAYRAALGAIGTAGRVSLMDYLK
jgi:flagellar hook-associated protein 3 FlgL